MDGGIEVTEGCKLNKHLETIWTSVKEDKGI